MLVSRHRRRYGGYIVHLGLLTLAVGVIGSQFFQLTKDATLAPGQSADIAGYSVTYRGISGSMDGSVQVIRTAFTVASHNTTLATIRPGEKIFPGFESQPTSIVSITTFGLNDLYVFLSGYEGTSSASIKMFVNPLVPLVWCGGLILLFGGALSGGQKGVAL